jgi:hypothetical protein
MWQLQPSKHKYNTVPEGWKKKFFQSEGEPIRTQFSLVDNLVKRVEKEAENDRILARTTTKLTAFVRTTSREEKMFPNRVFLTDLKHFLFCGNNS